MIFKDPGFNLIIIPHVFAQKTYIQRTRYRTEWSWMILPPICTGKVDIFCWTLSLLFAPLLVVISWNVFLAGRPTQWSACDWKHFWRLMTKSNSRLKNWYIYISFSEATSWFDLRRWGTVLSVKDTSQMLTSFGRAGSSSTSFTEHFQGDLTLWLGLRCWVDLSRKHRPKVLKAMSYISNRTSCIKFEPAGTSSPNYVTIAPGLLS